MEATIVRPQVIHKEMVAALRFPTKEVLKDEIAKQKRKMAVERAVILGNNERVKSRIIFEDSHKLQQVDTTIWGFENELVLLKYKMAIPIYRIHKVIIL